LSGASPAIPAAKPAIRPGKPKPETAQGLKPQPVVNKVIAIAEPASPRILPIGELPADVRQSLPKVVISGSTYSDNQALRMLIINGEVFREGEKPAPGLQLEQIRANAAVLNFKGLRYSVAY
jgi:general secretion pathway protein B